MARNYSSIAAATQVATAITASATSIKLQSVAGFPAPPFTLALDVSTSAEELVTVTAMAGLTLTVVRGEDGTAPMPHQVGAPVRHVISARDIREPQDHIEDSAGVHGLAPLSEVVGTLDAQRLRNKIIDALENEIVNLTAQAVAAGAIGTTQIADKSVTNIKLAGVDGAKIVSGTVPLDRLPAIPTTKISGDIDAKTIEGRKVFVQSATPVGKAGDIWFQVV